MFYLVHVGVLFRLDGICTFKCKGSGQCHYTSDLVYVMLSTMDTTATPTAGLL